MNKFYRILVITFLAGMSAVLTQAVLFNELTARLYTGETILCAILTGWFLGMYTGAGPVYSSLFKKKDKAYIEFAFAVVPVITSFLLPAIIYFAGRAQSLPLVVASNNTAYLRASVFTILISFPAGLFLALETCLAGNILEKEGLFSQLKILYIIETAGWVVGGFLYTLFLSVKTPGFMIVYWTGIITLAVLYITHREKSQQGLKISGVQIFALIAYLMPLMMKKLPGLGDVIVPAANIISYVVKTEVENIPGNNIRIIYIAIVMILGICWYFFGRGNKQERELKFYLPVTALASVLLFVTLVFTSQLYFGSTGRLIGLLFAFFSLGAAAGMILESVLKQKINMAGILLGGVLISGALFCQLFFAMEALKSNIIILVLFLILSGMITGSTISSMLGGNSVSRVYSINALGSFAGAVLTGYFLVNFAGLSGIVALTAMLLLAALMLCLSGNKIGVQDVN